VQLGADTIENIVLSKTWLFEIYDAYLVMDEMDSYVIEADARSV
jgi:hypothetical protein